LLFMLAACVKSFDLDIEAEEEQILVVDGALHDSQGPYFIRLSYTYPFDQERSTFIDDARVSVEDSDGRLYPFINSGDTIYQSPVNLQGEVGKAYKLIVEIGENRYETESQELLAAPAIDNVFGSFSEQPDPENRGFVGGIQFFIDSELIENNRTKYFRYDYEEAYKIVPPFPAVLKFNNEGQIVPLEETRHPCFVTRKSRELLFESTINSSLNKVQEFPIRFLSENQAQLRDRYAINIRQYAISESAYLFYDRITENNQASGSLFDRQVGSVFGNMFNVNDPNEPVLGFFEVSGVSEKLTFFNYFELDERFSRPGYPFPCSDPILIPLDSLQSVVSPESQLIYSIFGSPPDQFIGITNLLCGACNSFASTVPPDYWIE
ncbi:MAG: DUF4249 domain-containing protein, partial [Ekhidna sp.]|nr:DUF4249 domain-containing protein [Ekhidna sp.]